MKCAHLRATSHHNLISTKTSYRSYSDRLKGPMTTTFFGISEQQRILRLSHADISLTPGPKGGVTPIISSLCPWCASYSGHFAVFILAVIAAPFFFSPRPVEIILTLIWPLSGPFMKWVASDAKVYKRCCHRRNKESTGKMSLSARRGDFNVRWRPSVTRLAAAVRVRL